MSSYVPLVVLIEYNQPKYVEWIPIYNHDIMWMSHEIQPQ